MRVRILSIIVFLGIFYPLTAYAGLLGGGGSEQYPPETVNTGSPATIRFIVGAWGSGGPIKGRYQNIVLHYRLANEKTYNDIQPQPVPLPENYQKAVSDTRQWEAYEFTIPPYPAGTTGEIEYYITMTFDGYANTAKGYKTIKIVSAS